MSVRSFNSETVAAPFTLAAVGDLLVSRPVSSMTSRLPGFAEVVAALQDADATFGNFETTLYDVRDKAGTPMGWEDEWPVHSEHSVARDLRDMGFNALGRANNHALDWSIDSLQTTDRLLDLAGLQHAGTGATASEARAPRYVDADAVRVGLVSLTTSPATPVAAAVDPWRGDLGRPGVNHLPCRRVIVVPENHMRTLRSVLETAPELETSWIPPRPESPERIEIGHVVFEVGRTWEERFELDESALNENLRSIRMARLNSDVVIAAVHAHQGDRRSQEPRPFLREVAHRLVDAGADFVVVSGPHTLAPVEAYGGRPIVYGLGNFFWHVLSEPVQRYLVEQSAEAVRPGLAMRLDDQSFASDQDVLDVMSDLFEEAAFFDALLARVEFDGLSPSRLKLTPLQLSLAGSATTRGIPQRADAANSDRILSSLAEMSAPLDTEVQISAGIGTVDLG